MPFFTAVAANPLPAATYNANVRDQVITQCTSGTRPATPAEGQFIYETDTDLFLRYDGSSWVFPNVTAWTAVTFENSWTDTGGSTPSTRYRRNGERIEVRLACSTGSSGTVAFTLPAGFRPANTIRRPLDGAGGYAVAEITSAGAVALTGTASIQGEFGFSTL